jgi:hypothetical protein
MFQFKIERENSNLGIYKCKNDWINIGCAKNNNDIEYKLLNFIEKNINNLENIKNIKIRILDRINNSEIISELSKIHNEITINNLFEKLYNNRIEKLNEENVKIDWYRGRILLDCTNPYNQDSYNKAISNGSNTLIIYYKYINKDNYNIYSTRGILTDNEIPEIAKTDLTINNYEYNINYEWLKDKNIYTGSDTITIMNNNEKYKYYQKITSPYYEDFENKTILNGNYKIELYHNWN